MGTWGAGSFDNDDGADFAVEFESEGLEALRDAFDIVGEDDLEAAKAQRAIAAAEILALTEAGDAADQAISPELYEAVQRYASEILPQIAQLRRLALAALDRIEADRSELKQLWEEDDPTEWSDAMTALRERLSTPARRG